MTEPRDFDRVEAERLRRLQACFNADRPGNNELRAALQRWHLSEIRSERTLPVRVGRLIVGAMLLSGGALAATRVAQLPVWTSLVAWAKPSSGIAAASGSKPNACFMLRAGRRVDCRTSANVKLAPGEQASLIVNNVTTELMGPGVAHLRFEAKSGTWVSRFEPQGWAPVVAVVPAASVGQSNGSSSSPPAQGTATHQDTAKHGTLGVAPKPEPPSSQELEAAEALINPATASAMDGAWSRAAAALRRGDDGAARSALSEISRSSDPTARDAALLAQAQLDLAAGRRDSALPLLNQLARNGSTAFIRQRAEEIIVSGK